MENISTTDYISREAAIIPSFRYQLPNGEMSPPVVFVKTLLHSIHAADVREVVRGKWKPRDLTWGRSYYYCSACEETVDMPTAMGIPMFCYCPNCGADMREES